MKFKTVGIIIKEQTVGESDRLVTVLSKENGIIHAFVRGAKTFKNKLSPSTQLFAYSTLTFYRGRDAYNIIEGEPIEVFFELRKSIEKLSLAQYFCELILELAPVEDYAEEYLRLLLNSLYLLVNDKKSHEQLKSVVELRLLSISGYLPDLTCCNSCGIYEINNYLFLPADGIILCNNCINNNAKGIGISSSVLNAMRFICYSEMDRIFSFTLPEPSMKNLSEITELYLKEQIQKSFKTLEFYKSMKGLI